MGAHSPRESGEEGVRSQSSPSPGFQERLGLEFPLEGGYDNFLHLFQAGHDPRARSSRFVDSLLESGRKGERGVQNDSEQSGKTEAVYLVDRKDGCFWWQCVCGLESELRSCTV